MMLFPRREKQGGVHRWNRMRRSKNLVGGGEEGRWHVDAELPRGLGIDDQLAGGRWLNRYVGGIVAFKNAVNVTRCAYVGFNRCWLLGGEAATLDDIAERVNRR